MNDNYEELMYINGSWERIGGGGEGTASSSESGFGLPVSTVDKSDYCKEWTYETLDRYVGAKLVDKLTTPGGCSSRWDGSTFERNFDWKYNNSYTTVIKTPHTVGFGNIDPANTTDLTQEEIYKAAPFAIVDGVNDWGLVVSMHVVPDQGRPDYDVTVPSDETRLTINPLMLVRYILDNFRTAGEAAIYIQEHVAVEKSAALKAMGYDLQFAIWSHIDNTSESYVLNFIDEENVITQPGDSAMTNFIVAGTPAEYASYITNPVYGDPTSEGVTSLGAGVERYNLMLGGEELDYLYFSNAYDTSKATGDPDTDTFWYSEFVSEAKPLGTDVSQYDLTTIQDLYDNRDRNTGLTWQTVHSVTYDCLETEWIYISYSTQEDTDVNAELTLKKQDSLTQDELFEVRDMLDKRWRPQFDELLTQDSLNVNLRFIKTDALISVIEGEV